MSLRGMSLLTLSLLSGCAFIDGLHNPQSQMSATASTQGETVTAPGAVAPAPIDNQNTPVTDAAKMVSPIQR